MPRPRNLPEPYREGSFRVRDAREARVPVGSIRTLASPFHGVRSHEPPMSVVDRFAALRLVRPDGLALSHCSGGAASSPTAAWSTARSPR